MSSVLGCDHAWLIGHGNEVFPHYLCEEYEGLIKRRELREPVAYLTGIREFWSIPFGVTPDTLIPRPDSETLVETALKTMPKNTEKIIDLGTGTGCLLLSLLHERDTLQGVGIDISRGAVAVAEKNARTLGMLERAEVHVGSWGVRTTLIAGGPFDVVISNPPYIPELEIEDLAPDIRWFEPNHALNGGGDGLGAYRLISKALPELLKPGGYFFGEFGIGQGAELSDIISSSGLIIEGLQNDASGHQRCIVARMAK
jgi:release factor glutamine methyltransferase